MTCPICAYEGTDPGGHDNAKHLAEKQRHKGRVVVDTRAEASPPQAEAYEWGEERLPAAILGLMEAAPHLAAQIRENFLAGLRGERPDFPGEASQRSLSLTRPEDLELERPERTRGDAWEGDDPL